MFKEILGLSFLVSISPVSLAYASPSVEQLSECYQKKGTLEKVSCYDSLAEEYGAAPKVETGETPTGKWKITSKVNPLDDSKTYVALLREEENRSGFMNKTVSLILRCQSDKTEVYINWGDYLGDDGTSVYTDYKNVIERIGTEKAQTRKWGVSTDKKATFAPTNSDIDLITKLDKSNRYVVQTTPYGENPKTATFDLSGIESVANNLSETCNWKEILEASRN